MDVSIQEYYKHKQESHKNELNTESYKVANLPKNISFHGLIENSRFSLSVYALKHFDSSQNNIYRAPNDMKYYSELYKHIRSNFLVES